MKLEFDEVVEYTEEEGEKVEKMGLESEGTK